MLRYEHKRIENDDIFETDGGTTRLNRTLNGVGFRVTRFPSGSTTFCDWSVIIPANVNELYPAELQIAWTPEFAGAANGDVEWVIRGLSIADTGTISAPTSSTAFFDSKVNNNQAIYLTPWIRVGNSGSGAADPTPGELLLVRIERDNSDTLSTGADFLTGMIRWRVEA